MADFPEVTAEIAARINGMDPFPPDGIDVPDWKS
jgi:hypothetical protein